VYKRQFENSPLTTDGDLLVRSSGNVSRLAIGTDGQHLSVASGVPSWTTPLTLTNGEGTTANGSAVDLGGTLSGDSTITSTDYTFQAQGDTNLARMYVDDENGESLIGVGETGDNQSSVFFSPNYATLRVGASSGNQMVLSLNGEEGTGINVKDSRDSIGLRYEADYSTANSSNDRWLADKGYVDAAVSSLIESSPIDNAIPTWDSATGKFITSSTLTYVDGATSTFTHNADTDSTTILGRLRVASITSNFAQLRHYDQTSSTSYGLSLRDTGATFLNSASGQSLSLQIGGNTQWSIDSTGNLVNSAVDLDMTSGGQLKLANGSAATPSLHWGTNDGIYSTAGYVRITNGGSNSFSFLSSQMFASNTSAASIINEAASATNPTLIPFRGAGSANLDTGIGGTGTTLSLITQGAEALNIDASQNIAITAGDLSFSGTSGTIVVPSAPTTTTDGALRNNSNVLEMYHTSTWNAIGGGDVTAASNLSDNSIVIGSGGSKGVDTSNFLTFDGTFLIIGDTAGGTQPYITIDESTGLVRTRSAFANLDLSGNGTSEATTTTVPKVMGYQATGSTAEAITIDASVLVSSDTGSVPAMIFNSYQSDGTALVTRPHSAGYNLTTKLWEVAASGSWDYQGNDLTGVKDLIATSSNSLRIFHSVNTSLVNLVGGGVGNGATLSLYGSSHSTEAGNLHAIVRNGGVIELQQKTSTAGVTVVKIEQTDVDESFIDFIGTSASDGTRSISSDTTEDDAKFGAIRIEINGVTKWIRVYDGES
jgi:hypothetical protein